MIGIKAITVCVDYDDFLAVTIARTLQYVSELLVVTTPQDHRTLELIAKHPKAKAYTTEAFYQDGASFNKGRALEEGFDVLGRTGWILILDSDILLPAKMPSMSLSIGNMYTPRRRILKDVDGLVAPPTVDPATLPIRRESGNFGYFQLFHADDHHVQERPWYQTDWVHAGGADSVFEKRWPKIRKMRLPFDVIHLGDPDQNWYGRVRPRIDTGEVLADAKENAEKLKALHAKYGWAGVQKTGQPVAERLASADGMPETAHDHTSQRRIIRGNFRPVQTRKIKKYE